MRKTGKEIVRKPPKKKKKNKNLRHNLYRISQHKKIEMHKKKNLLSHLEEELKSFLYRGLLFCSQVLLRLEGWKGQVKINSAHRYFIRMSLCTASLNLKESNHI